MVAPIARGNHSLSLAWDARERHHERRARKGPVLPRDRATADATTSRDDAKLAAVALRMAEDPWQRPARILDNFPPVTDRVVAATEQRLGVRLPAAYVRILRLQNGGYIRGGHPEITIREIDGIGDGVGAGRTTWWHDDIDNEWWGPEGKDLLINFAGDGHWDLCLDYRINGPDIEPTVAYIDNEAEEDEPVAASFEEFLDQLVEYEGPELRIYSTSDLDEVAEAVAAACGAELRDLGAQEFGFRRLELELPDGQRAWISPNDVPAGFRLQGTDVVTTPERALRLPNDPDCRLTIACVSDSGRDLIRGAARAGGYIP